MNVNVGRYGGRGAAIVHPLNWQIKNEIFLHPGSSILLMTFEE
jgi:hypothetical protein